MVLNKILSDILYFCMYLTDYSVKSAKQRSKVGRRRIVFFSMQFFEAFYSFIINETGLCATAISALLQDIYYSF